MSFEAPHGSASPFKSWELEQLPALEVDFPAHLRLSWSCGTQQAWNLTGTRGRLRQLDSDFLGWTFAMTQPAEFGHIIWFRLEMNANVLRLQGPEVWHAGTVIPICPVTEMSRAPGSNLTQNKVIWSFSFWLHVHCSAKWCLPDSSNSQMAPHKQWGTKISY